MTHSATEKQQTQLHRNNLLIWIRYLLLLCCFLLTLIPSIPQDAQIVPVDRAVVWQFFVVVVIINSLYLVILPHLPQRFLSAFLLGQIFVDIFIETILIYLTGGILSIYVSLYFTNIVAASIFISLRAALLVASLCTICISSITSLYFLSILNDEYLPLLGTHAPLTFPKDDDIPFCRAYLIAQSIAFYLIALLGGYLVTVLSKQKIVHEEILQHMGEGILVVGVHQNIIFINKAACKLLNLSCQENHQGKNITKVLDSKKHIDLLKAFMSQEPHRSEIELHQNSRSLYLQIKLSPIEVKNKLRACILILRDISQEKEMQETIKRADRLSTINEMATSIAHEIRNPLASIRGAIQELQEGVPVNDRKYLLMDITIRESDRLNKIVSDFLEFSKLRSPNFQPCFVTGALREVVLFLQQRNKEENIHIQSEIAEGLHIFADSGHLRQIFYNLGINAMEASPQECELKIQACSLSLHQFARQEKLSLYLQGPDVPGVYVCFSDKGAGIKPHHLERIFDPFFSTKTHGTGMGLAVVSQILDSHHAIYRIKSEVGKGTDFLMWFPQSPELINSEEDAAATGEYGEPT